MILIRVAWRNIWRSRKRSLIIIIALTIGLSSGMFLIAFYSGMIEDRVNTAVRSEYSHLQIHHPAFRQDLESVYAIPDADAVIRAIVEEPGLQAYTRRVLLPGTINSSYGSRGITICGVDPVTEDAVTGLRGKLVEGEYFDTSRLNQIIVSERTMRKLKLNVGNKVVLTFQDTARDIASAAFRICGMYASINAPYDEQFVFVQRTSVDTLAGIPGKVHEIAVLMDHNEMVAPFVKKLSDQYTDAEVLSWMDLSPELRLTVSAVDQMVYIFMGIILLALAFGIVNTMMMSVLERTHEISMLMALGMTKARVFSMIVLETLFLVIAGSPAGFAIALTAISITRKTGVTLKGLEELYASFGYSGIVYPVLQWHSMLTIGVMIIIAACISSIFPALRALKLKPAQAIRK